MDANGKLVTKASAEISMTENPKSCASDLMISIPEDENDSKPIPAEDQKFKLSADSPLAVSNNSGFSSPEIARFGPRLPKIPSNVSTLTRRKSLSRMASKPKSRFGEQSVPIDQKMFEDDKFWAQEHVLSSRGSPITNMDVNGASIRGGNRTVSIAVKTSAGVVDEDEEIFKKVSSMKKLKYRKVKARVLIEWLLFLSILGCLIASLTVHEHEKWKLWGLHIWKWLVLVLVTFSGMLITNWLMHFVVLLIELNYLLKKKVLYFVYGLKKSVGVCIWLSLVLITWVFLFEGGVERSRATKQILNFITWTIASVLIGAFLWLLKTLSLKILASSFHVNSFFERIQESVFDQYILVTLSGPAVMESEQMSGRTNSNVTQFSFQVTKKGKEGKNKKQKEAIDINKLCQMKQGKVTASTMKTLTDMISNSGLNSLSNIIDESVNGGNEQTDNEIIIQEMAIAAAFYIFINVAKPGSKYIDELDLRRFMTKEVAEIVFPMIASETWEIDRKVLMDWVLKVYKERKALFHALNDTKTAVKQLNKIVSGILMIVMVVVWLLLTGIATTKVVVFLSSQLVLAAFMFGNTCKMIFEAIIFVFVMHPFHVGDRCLIDGVQMIVEEMNILTTVFLKFDKEKIYYPNSVLATKPISNFNRSPDMGDSLEFCIDFKTPLEKIASLKVEIKGFLDKNPQHWHPDHSVILKEIENVNKLKMALFFNHTMNFQDFAEKSRRKSDLVLEIKRIFEELNIRYHLLPQHVHFLDTSG